jgi:SAM-dependent methyltransferase
MKQLAVKILRSLGLIYVIDMLRYHKTRLQTAKKNEAYLAQHPGIAFPPPYMIYETFRLDYQRYYEKGRESAEWIKDEVSPFKELKNSRIYDWGCGPGRVIRHMPEVVNNGCEFYASDYNEAYVQWCQANLPGITVKKNELSPPLPFENELFDLVYGISIFTHLSEQKHYDWLNEHLRVLKQGGILFITTHGDITRANLTQEEDAIYQKGELVERANVKEGHRMYVAYQPIPFMHRLIKDKFRILKHTPGSRQSWGFSQDVWILEKI